MSNPSPKKVTVYGRLSFPTLTAEEAFERSQKGNYPAKDVASAAPDFQLLLSQVQFDKLRKHAQDVFLPYCVAQEQAGEKRDSLTAKEAKALAEQLDGDLADQMYNTPVKPVHEKTAPLAPDAVAALKCIGPKGGEIGVQAVVNHEQELSVPDPDLLSFPVIRPINSTVHQLYPGCVAAATLNLYAYHNGKHPGFSAGVTTVVFKADADRFGGGVDVDQDEIFLD